MFINLTVLEPTPQIVETMSQVRAADEIRTNATEARTRHLLRRKTFCIGRKISTKLLNTCVGKLFKANMKSYIPLETAAIFFLANLFLKQGMG